MTVLRPAVALMERGLLPDPLVRAGIRRVLARRLVEEDAGGAEARREALYGWVEEMRSSPVALVPDEANRQHYELPAEFFATVLGPHLKYSACRWPEDVDDLPFLLDSELRVDRHWRLNGCHYSRTLEAWLERMDRARADLMPLFATVYGADARRWFERWRVFFLACSELFRYRRGEEWWVSHYLMRQRRAPSGVVPS